jgi:hypothetical protein
MKLLAVALYPLPGCQLVRSGRARVDLRQHIIVEFRRIANVAAGSLPGILDIGYWIVYVRVILD